MESGPRHYTSCLSSQELCPVPDAFANLVEIVLGGPEGELDHDASQDCQVAFDFCLEQLGWTDKFVSDLALVCRRCEASGQNIKRDSYGFHCPRRR